MATIIQHRDKWRATVKRYRDGQLVLNRSRSFDLRKDAQAWATKLEAEADRDLDSLLGKVKAAGLNMGDVIDRYQTEFDTPAKPWGKTKKYVAATMLRADIAKKDALKVTSQDWIEFGKERASLGNQPSTVYQYVSVAAQVYKVARPMWGIPLDPSVIEDAKIVLTAAGLIAAMGNERDRRLEGDEEQMLLAWLKNYDETRARSTPCYERATRFAIASGMREGEICRIRRADLNLEQRTIKIRDRKDPRRKKGNDETIPLLGDMLPIIKEQITTIPASEQDDRIFPLNEGTFSQVFARAVEALHIEDLTLHDMRHEGTSRLFEADYQIQEVALVTGHKKWDTLKRYTQMRASHLLKREKEIIARRAADAKSNDHKQ